MDFCTDGVHVLVGGFYGPKNPKFPIALVKLDSGMKVITKMDLDESEFFESAASETLQASSVAFLMTRSWMLRRIDDRDSFVVAGTFKVHLVQAKDGKIRVLHAQSHTLANRITDLCIVHNNVFLLSASKNTTVAQLFFP